MEIGKIEKVKSDKRYIVVECSESNHCCFSFTVVDTSAGKRRYNQDDVDSFWESCLCETFEKKDADLIVDALNKYYASDDQN